MSFHPYFAQSDSLLPQKTTLRNRSTERKSAECRTPSLQKVELWVSQEALVRRGGVGRGLSRNIARRLPEPCSWATSLHIRCRRLLVPAALPADSARRRRALECQAV